MPQENLQTRTKNALSELGEKIFLDRYAIKDIKRESLKIGDTVIVNVNLKTGQREIGILESYDKATRKVCSACAMEVWKSGTLIILINRLKQSLNKCLPASPGILRALKQARKSARNGKEVQQLNGRLEICSCRKNLYRRRHRTKFNFL
jgi:hypothetical protein